MVKAEPQENIINEESINFADYLRVISKNGRMIFRIFTITILSAAVVSLFLPKMYSATASIVPPIDNLQSQSIFSSGISALKNPLLQQVMDVSSLADMYAGILQSRSIADALIDGFNLSKVFGHTKYIDLRRKLAKRTSVNVGEDGIVSVTVEDRDPCMAALLANAYIEELDKQNKRLFAGQAAGKKVFLENRLNEIQQELKRVDNLLTREAKIKEMLFEMLTQEYEVAKIEEAKSIPTIQVLDTAVIPEKKSKPKRLQIIFLSGITSLLVGIFVAFTREHFARESLFKIKDSLAK